MADLKLSVDVSDVQKALTATQRYERQINQLAQRYARGQVSSAAYNRGLLQIKRSYEQLGLSSQKATSEVRRYAQQQLQAARDIQQAAVAQRNLAAATQTSSRGMNAMGVGMQQAGYQIGDFLVQVQSGTNFMVAFGQQATQLVGILPMFNSVMGISGTALVALSAGLGIAIPLVTAIGAAFMRTSGEGQTLEESVNKLTESFSELADNLEIVGDTELELRFGNLTSEIRSLASAMAELNAASQLDNLLNTLESVSESTQAGFLGVAREALLQTFVPGYGLDPNEASATDRANRRAFEDLGLPMGREDFLGEQGFLGRMQGAAGAGDREGVVRIFEEMVAQIREAEGGMAAVSQEGRNLVAQMYQAALSTAETNALLNGSAEEAARAAEQAERNTEAYRELLELSQDQQQSELDRASTLYERLSSLRQETQLQQEIARYGEQSAQVAELRAAQEREAVRLEAMKAGFFNESLQAIMDQYDASVEATQEAERNAEAWERVSGMNLGSLNSQVQQLMILTGMAADEALRFAANMPIGTSGGDAARGGRGVTLAMGDRRPNFDMDLGLGRYAPRETGGGGGGGGGTPEFASRVFGPELQEAIEQAQQDLSRYNQEVQMLDTALRAGLITQQEYNSFVAQAQEVYNQAQQSAYDYEKALEQVEKTTMSSMENAFMSIIDGSKSASEAFKDMARQILAEAMRMMVIRPLIQGLFGGGGGKGGGIFSALFRESGGTMMANRPYIVGERGPELVMPSRSGTVMNADLTRKAMGGSDGVVVNQTINVTGGTDPAAIRQEVAKLMPQITNATKTAVIDARRRGGQMRAAFQ